MEGLEDATHSINLAPEKNYGQKKYLNPKFIEFKRMSSS